MIMGYTLYNKGKLFGYATTDPKEQKTIEAKGAGFGHIKLGNRWFDIGSLSPVSSLLLTGASFGREWKRYIEGEEKAGAKFMRNAKDIMFTLVKEQPFVRGGMETLSEKGSATPENVLPALISLDSFIPAIVGEVAQSLDDKARDTRGETVRESIVNRIKAKIPMLRNSLPERLNVFGEPAPNPYGQDPFRIKPDIDTPLTREILDVDFGVNYPKREDKETLESYRARIKNEGQGIKKALTYAIESPNYDETILTKDQRKQLLSDIAERARKEARENKLSDNEEKFNTDVLIRRENSRTKMGIYLNSLSGFKNKSQEDKDKLINSVFNKAMVKGKDEDRLDTAKENLEEILEDPMQVLRDAAERKLEREEDEEE
jgi:hypothetical protein